MCPDCAIVAFYRPEFAVIARPELKKIGRWTKRQLEPPRSPATVPPN